MSILAASLLMTINIDKLKLNKKMIYENYWGQLPRLVNRF